MSCVGRIEIIMEQMHCCVFSIMLRRFTAAVDCSKTPSDSEKETTALPTPHTLFPLFPTRYQTTAAVHAPASINYTAIRREALRFRPGEWDLPGKRNNLHNKLGSQRHVAVQAETAHRPHPLLPAHQAHRSTEVARRSSARFSTWRELFSPFSYLKECAEI